MNPDQIATLLKKISPSKEPSAEELQYAASCLDVHGRNEAWLNADERLLTENPSSRKMLLLYSSCHCEQIIKYLRHYRQDVLDQFFVNTAFTHRMQLNPDKANCRFLWELFACADVVFCNILSSKFGNFSTDILLGHCKPGCRVVSFVPPSCACWWPVTEHHGEEPVERYLRQSVSVEDMVAKFDSGSFDCMFNYRFKDQLGRLAFRERLRDVGLSQYVLRHYKTHKMFFTYNHPSFHVMSFLTDAMIGLIGMNSLGEDHSLSVPVNLAEFGNHYPETKYEWDYFGFTYPMTCQNERGGAKEYYAKTIGEIANRVRASGIYLGDPEDDY